MTDFDPDHLSDRVLLAFFRVSDKDANLYSIRRMGEIGVSPAYSR